MLDATCDETGKVTAEDVIVPEALVLSAGKQASEGILLIEGKKPRYLTSSASDIATTIDKTMAIIDDLNGALNKLVLIITSIGAGMTGPTTAPPPTLATDLLDVTAKVTALTAVKTELETLKGALK